MIQDSENLPQKLNELQQRYDQLWTAYLALINENRENIERQHERFREMTAQHWMPK